jgi:hypothetical protein
MRLRDAFDLSGRVVLLFVWNEQHPDVLWHRNVPARLMWQSMIGSLCSFCCLLFASRGVVQLQASYWFGSVGSRSSRKAAYRERIANTSS